MISPYFKSNKPPFSYENIGIGDIYPMYIETSNGQDKQSEYKKIEKFLNKYLQEYSRKKAINLENLNIEFINYGKTELVYVLSEKSGTRITLLVKQPAVQFGKVQQEAKNLFSLNKRDKNVIAPIDYFQFEGQELYATPYINQARCIASTHSWGMYIPEPYYKFVPFSPVQEQIVISCMIAKLVALYDFSNQEGIGSCKLGGGDFMLSKDWECKTPTIENTLNNLYLIAAREKIHCSFDEYLKIVKSEFSKSTFIESPKKPLINSSGRVPMQIEHIESGISLGLSIIQGKKIPVAKSSTQSQALEKD